jgi:hypothetical protein
MKNFIITCTINSNCYQLNIKFKQSAIALFYIYKTNCWIGTMQKRNNKYLLISYSNFPISQNDINNIGEQINLHNKLTTGHPALSRTLKAA